MNIVFFSNPDFFGSQRRPAFSSMPRFTSMLADGMTQRGHKVSVWSPRSRCFNLPVKGNLKKYLGYIDQYILFPSDVKSRLKECPKDTLFVFTDQAQGPWVRLVSNRLHVMHCHDFLAQKAALGTIDGQRTGWTGKKYQKYIRRGYAYCKNFISGSLKTNEDLKELIDTDKRKLSVVYNGLEESYKPASANVARIRTALGNKINTDLSAGYLLHVGGNQWYKNRVGVVELYNAWRRLYNTKLPLLLLGAEPSEEIWTCINESPFQDDIHVISGLTDLYIRSAYSGASVFLFPSLAEGFGWPIAEAMGCGCPVITTDEAPMTEVAGNVGFLLRKKTQEDTGGWAIEGAAMINYIISLSDEERNCVVQKSLENVRRFDFSKALNEIEIIYNGITA